MLSLVEVYASRLLNYRSSMSDDHQLKASTRVYLAVQKAEGWDSLWIVGVHHLFCHRFKVSWGIRCHICALCIPITLCLILHVVCYILAGCRWQKGLWGAWALMEVFHSYILRWELELWNIWLGTLPGMGWFVREQAGKGSEWWLDISVVHWCISTSMRIRTLRGGTARSDISEREKSQTYAVQISHDVKNSGNGYQDLKSLARFNPFQYIKDLQFFEGDRTPQMVQQADAREAIQILINYCSAELGNLEKTRHNVLYDITEHWARMRALCRLWVGIPICTPTEIWSNIDARRT